jgi:FkbH-like protein
MKVAAHCPIEKKWFTRDFRRAQCSVAKVPIVEVVDKAGKLGTVLRPRDSSMTLLDALELLKRPIPEPASERAVSLECGFTPLHLKTFLAADLRLRFPKDRIEIRTGLYGDLAGNLERLQPSGGWTVVVVEWADLDPRLGIRSLGGWRSADVPDIVESTRRQGERLTHLMKQLASSMPICVSTPTLPLPPIFTTRGGQAHQHECQLREIAASLATSLSAHRRVRLLNLQRLDELSPLGRRFDAKAEITTGFPYSLEHASTLAQLLAELVQDCPPKKGLITDLDDTLWAGILGEIGVEGITWDMAGHAHMHGLYQQFLASLASAGVLLAAASKNDPALVEQALARNDILLSKDSFFPVEAHWEPKSVSVGHVLETWNVAPGDVVFIDDSPMEVAEVRAVFPEMEGIVFPKGDYQGIWDLLQRLRNCFGKSIVSPEDEIRLRSIRAASSLRSSVQGRGLGAGDFLRNVEATITFCLGTAARDNRAFELINKTNQFNLNGKRLSESDWLSFFRDPAAFLLTASYQDKYGPLGRIAVVMGKMDGRKVYVNSWVMSCRAFSRRIEHQCLKYLFEKLDADEIVFDYEVTPRNGPLQDFFRDLLEGPPAPALSLRKACLNGKAQALFHRIVEVANV